MAGLEEKGISTEQIAHQRQRARHHAVPPRPRRRFRGASGLPTRSVRRKPWYRPVLPGQVRALSASASRTCSTRRSCARSSRRRSRSKTTSCQSIYDMPTYTVDQHLPRNTSSYAEKIRAHVVDCTPGCSTTRCAPARTMLVRGRPGDAARHRSRHLSRLSRRPTARRAVP